MTDSLLCLIPARSGSKGVPNKNVRLLLGEPLITHTIRTAIAAMQSLAPSAGFQIAVSSDSEFYLEVASKMGVYTILRPAEIANDLTPMAEVVGHALEYFDGKGTVRYQTVLLLQPTCPARQPWHIEEAYRLYRKRSVDSLVSVVRMEDAHPARMYTRDQENFGHSLQTNDAAKNRQNLMPVFHRNGAIYLFDRSLVNQKSLISQKPLLYEMEKKYSINIDDEVDWIYAEALCKYLLKN
jgi:CMP-N-acetylneuraminic acid synthetase